MSSENIKMYDGGICCIHVKCYMYYIIRNMSAFECISVAVHVCICVCFLLIIIDFFFCINRMYH